MRRKGPRQAARSVDLTLPSVVVNAVSPDSVPLSPGERLHLAGVGFGPATDPPPQVTLAGLALTVDGDHTDTLLVVTLPAEATTAGQAISPEGKTEMVIVRRDGWQEAVKPVKLTQPQ